jgi:hypothetical protein
VRASPSNPIAVVGKVSRPSKMGGITPTPFIDTGQQIGIGECLAYEELRNRN